MTSWDALRAALPAGTVCGVPKVGEFPDDNRAGMDRTLHRVSAIRNRAGGIVGLTCRTGRAISGSAERARDLVAGGGSLLLTGPPGVGKTTAIRSVIGLFFIAFTKFMVFGNALWAMKGAERASGFTVDNGVVGAPLAIVIRDLALSVKSDRGDVPVLKECSLNVPEGQFWMLLGPNGCGKSTLLKAMAGLLRPNGGQMYVIGPRSFVFQNPDHQVVMPTAEADVAFGSGRFDLPLGEVRKRVYESLDAVGMAEYAQRSVQTLSGGQKQRIAIAGALAESSRLLLLDELTTYLDSGDQIGVLEAVLKVVKGPQAVTALWVTHRLEELEYADGAAYMENGRVVISGSVADIKKYIQMKQEEYFKGQDVLR